MVSRNVGTRLPSDTALYTKTRIQHFLTNRPNICLWAADNPIGDEEMCTFF
jgi:hypothetical protein